MKDYAVNLLKEMVEIYSPSGKEENIANFLSEEMSNLGFQVRKDEVGNVIGEIGEGDPTILLCGHMDTVPKHLPVYIENNQLYGRGAVDAKAPLAAMVVAASTFTDQDLENKIVVCGVVDEEGANKGIKHLVKEGISADYAIFGEPSGIERIVIGYKGDLYLKITCKTKTGHSAASWLFPNAIEKSFQVWERIRTLHFPEEKPESKFYSLTSCLTKIKGGEAYNVVPAQCTIQLDLRIPPQFTCPQINKEIRSLIQQYQTDNPDVTVNMEVKHQIPPFESKKDSSLILSLARAIRKVRHRPVTLLRKTGSGDMNLFGNATKVPTVTYGPGDSRLDHTSKEHIDLQEYSQSIQILRETLTKLTSHPQRE
ncbi:MAG: M20/M25/M40 family metallo-hydrolase [Thermoproteota archaeon]